MVDRDQGALVVGLLHDAGGATAPSRVAPVDDLAQPEAVHVAVERRDLAAADRRDDRRPGVDLAEVADGVVIGDGQEVLASLDRATDPVGHRDLAVAVDGVRVEVSAVPARTAGRRHGRGSGGRRRGTPTWPLVRATRDRGAGLEVVPEHAGLDTVVEDLPGADDEQPLPRGDRSREKAERGVRLADRDVLAEARRGRGATKPSRPEERQVEAVSKMLGPEVWRIIVKPQPELGGPIRDLDLEPMMLVTLAVRPLAALVEQRNDHAVHSGGAELFHERRLTGQVAVEDPFGDVHRRDQGMEREGPDRHR